MPTKITFNDITDHMIKGIVKNDSTYFDRADLELIQLCAEWDVDPDDVPVVLPHRVKEWEKAWVAWQVCLDNMGVNVQKQVEQGIQMIDDPYAPKAKVYGQMEARYKKSINKEILEGEADSPSEFTYATIRTKRRS